MTDPSTLTNDQLNRAVAEARGWTSLHAEQYGSDEGTQFEVLVGRAPGGVHDHDKVPRPADRIEDAWPLVEEMCAAGWVVRILIAKDRVMACLWGGDWPGKPPLTIEATTAPRAITLAWLRWRRQQGA